MGDVVNLNRFRKRRGREEEAARAAENRARFGRTKAEKERERLEAEKAAHELDGKRKE